MSRHLLGAQYKTEGQWNDAVPVYKISVGSEGWGSEAGCGRISHVPIPLVNNPCNRNTQDEGPDQDVLVLMGRNVTAPFYLVCVYLCDLKSY